MFIIATETANKESDRFFVGETEVRVFQVESLDSLADYFAVEARDYMEKYGLTVTFKEVTKAQATVPSSTAAIITL